MNLIIISIGIILAIAVIAIIIYIIRKNNKSKSNQTSTSKPNPAPDSKPCPVCPDSKPCPTCPDEKICPTCPDSKPCPVCPDEKICPTCPDCKPCPTCPDCKPCPTCPDEKICPTCPDCKQCPACPDPKPDPGPNPGPTLKNSFMEHLDLDQYKDVSSWTPECIKAFNSVMSSVSDPGDPKTLNCLLNNLQLAKIMPNTLLTDYEFTNTLQFIEFICGTKIDIDKLKPYIPPTIPLDCKDSTWTDDCKQKLAKNILLVLSRFGITENDTQTIQCVLNMFITGNNIPYYYFIMSHDKFVDNITKIYDNICHKRDI